MTTVWVSETGDYEQRGVWGVHSSVAAGLEDLRRAFKAPYRVTWESPVSGYAEGAVEVTGFFDAVPGYSIRHSATWTFTPYVVDADH